MHSSIRITDKSTGADAEGRLNCKNMEVCISDWSSKGNKKNACKGVYNSINKRSICVLSHITDDLNDFFVKRYNLSIKGKKSVRSPYMACRYRKRDKGKAGVVQGIKKINQFLNWFIPSVCLPCFAVYVNDILHCCAAILYFCHIKIIYF